ncbi:ribonuclease 3-like protein 1 [Trifolium pratense]|uniref:ribonuclease 3-like protein 1 n=1 Tax=Trifolium pratense TaxID=57577 RepID=UPI001E697242|nr:ribonuclease 3-like protein 1 [Trifolium pratense]XP_045807005.1 ribonuclease 3-like protein 1 [Trifolium pratense]
MVKPNSNNPKKLVDSVETTHQNLTLKNMVVAAVKDKSSISSNKESVTVENTTTTPEQGVKKGCGRSKLHEICAANHWKPPVFECCKEEGPCHCIMFTFKVIIEIKISKVSKNVEISEKSKNIIEVYGAPHRKKKMAADDAAEGALWYLKHVGFGLKNK